MRAGLYGLAFARYFIVSRDRDFVYFGSVCWATQTKKLTEAKIYRKVPKMDISNVFIFLIMGLFVPFNASQAVSSFNGQHYR